MTPSLEDEMVPRWKETGHPGHCLKESCPVEDTFTGLECEQQVGVPVGFGVFWGISYWDMD